MTSMLVALQPSGRKTLPGLLCCLVKKSKKRKAVAEWHEDGWVQGQNGGGEPRVQ